MSAETSLDRVATVTEAAVRDALPVVDGTADRRTGTGRVVTPRHGRLRAAVNLHVGRAWNGHDRRATDPVSRLSRQLDTLCVGAVDAVEIAAGLEAAGFTDRTAREYGAQDVFGLAEVLFEATRPGRGRPGRPRLVNPWAERPVRHLLRGVAFAAPGLLFVACLPAVTTGADRAALVVAMLLGWPGSQGMAYLGHLLEGRRHPAGARAVLRLSLGLLALVAALFLAGATLAGVSRPVALLGAGEVLYLGAAAVVLVLGHERLALAVLAPGVVAAAAGLLGGPSLVAADPSVGSRAAAAGALVSLAGAVVAALWVLGRNERGDLRSGIAALSPDDRLDARWHIGYGAVGGLLVTLPSAAGLTGDLVAASLVPVIWSMGLAEWQVVQVRRRSFDLLNEAITLDQFREQAVRLLRRSVATYLAGLVVLTLAVPAVGWLLTGRLPSAAGVGGLSFGLYLGAFFFQALILASMGGVRTVVVTVAVALAVAAVALALLPTPVALLVAPLVALGLLLRPVRDAVSDPTRHM